MDIKTAAKSFAFRGLGASMIIVRLLIDLLKILFYGGIAYFGWYAFHLEQWYWNVFGIGLMISGLGAILPLIDVPICFILFFVAIFNPDHFK